MNCEKMIDLARSLFREERSINKLTGWFRIRESAAKHEKEYAALSEERRTAAL